MTATDEQRDGADDSADLEEPATTKWWGTFSFADVPLRRWLVGPLELLVARRPREWQVAYRYADDPLDQRSVVEDGAESEMPSAEAHPETFRIHRFAIESDDTELHLAPLLADRPVVARPDTPLRVVANARVELFLSTAVWIRVESGTKRRELTEFPAFRPSDSWFGSSTREGELCYASRTSARLRLSDMPIRPARAISAITIVNGAASPLEIERLKLPIPNLALLAGRDSRLWTNSLTLQRKGDGASLEVKSTGPRSPDESITQLSPPREPESGALFRALGALVG